MFETAAENNFDTVSDAAKGVIKILLPFLIYINDDVLYDPLSIDFSSCGYIPTEHVSRRVCDTLSMKTLSLGDETILETLNCAILIDRNRLVLGTNFKTQMVHAACRCCFIYELYDMFFKRSSPL